jgi:CBS domain-containing protein
MTKGAITCRDNTSLKDAARLMWEGDVGFLPVVDGNGRLVGAITDRDICMAAFTRDIVLRDASVGSAMAKIVFSVRADDNVQFAEDLFVKNQLRRLPVVDEEGMPVGVLTLSDLARRSTRDAKGVGVTSETVCRALRAVSQPRNVVKTSATRRDAVVVMRSEI